MPPTTAGAAPAASNPKTGVVWVDCPIFASFDGSLTAGVLIFLEVLGTGLASHVPRRRPPHHEPVVVAGWCSLALAPDAFGRGNAREVSVVSSQDPPAVTPAPHVLASGDRISAPKRTGRGHGRKGAIVPRQEPRVRAVDLLGDCRRLTAIGRSRPIRRRLRKHREPQVVSSGLNRIFEGHESADQHHDFDPLSSLGSHPPNCVLLRAHEAARGHHLP
jgi:hypothetical protein